MTETVLIWLIVVAGLVVIALVMMLSKWLDQHMTEKQMAQNNVALMLLSEIVNSDTMPDDEKMDLKQKIKILIEEEDDGK